MTRVQIEATPLLNGAQLPDFSLLDEQEQARSLADFTLDNGVTVAFIHGTWCPYCLRQLRRLNRIAPKLADLKVGLACITHDPVSTIYAYQQTSKPPLAYKLLADSAPSISQAYGVYDAEHESPYTAIFYATADHIVQYSDVSTDPDCFPNLERMLEVIQYGPKGEPL